MQNSQLEAGTNFQPLASHQNHIRPASTSSACIRARRKYLIKMWLIF